MGNLTLIMVPSQSWKNKNLENLENLYKYPWFFGELSEENAKEILVEGRWKDGNSQGKSIIFLGTGFDDIKKIHLNIVLGHLSQHDANGQPQFYSHEKYAYTNIENLVMRKNLFSLEELATVKTAISGVDPETLRLPKMIEDKLKKYQAFIKTSISSSCIAFCILEVRLFGATSFDSLARR